MLDDKRLSEAKEATGTDSPLTECNPHNIAAFANEIFECIFYHETCSIII